MKHERHKIGWWGVEAKSIIKQHSSPAFPWKFTNDTILQVMELGVHSHPSEGLPPSQENSCSNRCKANSKCHQCHYWRDIASPGRPIVEVKDHSKLYSISIV
jgi:hypothetical protein